MSTGDPVLDGLLANLDTASVTLGAAVKAAAPTDPGIAAALPASVAATAALAAYTVPTSQPPPPPPPPPGPLQLTTPTFVRTGGTLVIQCRASSDVFNATVDHPLGTKVAHDSGPPVANVLTWDKNPNGTPLTIPAGTVLNLRGWSTGPNYKPTNILTLTV